jgi:Cdc6-like AAA superfamily ATPase
MVKFRKHQKNVEKEADLAHKIEAAKAREIELARRELVAQNMRVKRRHKILASLPTVDYYAKHAKFSALRHPGTNVWLQTNPRFQSWSCSQVSDCLPFYGIPGSGKSVLAASVANDVLNSLQDAKTILCYYYCDYADTASLESTRLIASLIKQVLVHLSVNCFDDTFSCPYGAEKPSPSFEESSKFLGSLIDRFNTVFITIDGVDELTDDSQRMTLDLIDGLVKQSTATVQVFVTSRTEEHQVKRALKDYEAINLSADYVSSDIEIFIKAMVDSTIVKQNPLLENERLKNEVLKALVDGAQGM